MPLTAGTRLGVYEVLGKLGEGGMGEVYRALDTRLKREVAIKVLPEAFAQDPERLARLQREAEILATVNHPNIAQIYGLEDHALVLELVEGPTLADRVAQGAIPPSEALAIARQIAEALEAAHDRGIIHRDLKPANIKLRSDGTIKVLDFGLAKAVDRSAGAGSEKQDPAYVPSDLLSQSPTLVSPAAGTQIGVILGTAAYMSPEQAKGKPVDRRTDMWAFGCVLYEMLTARQAFKGSDVSDLMAEILKSEPEWTALPAALPPNIVRLLRRCLSKDPRTRLPDAAAARLEIEEALQPSSLHETSTTRPDKRRWMPWAVAAMALAVAGATVTLPRRTPQNVPERPVIRFSMSVPNRSITSPLVPTVSPDGRHILFHQYSRGYSGGVSIWIRSLDAAGARPLPGVDGDAYSPFWSPDSAFIAFFNQGKLRKVSIAGGKPETICDAPNWLGGTWSRDGTILFGSSAGLMQVAASGGQARPAKSGTPSAKGDSQMDSQMWPQFLPDGRRFIYFSSAENAIRLGSLDSAETRELLRADGQARYVAGYLLFVQQGTLRARPFDVARGEFAGDAVEVAQQIAVLPNWSHADFSVSDNGVLVYSSIAGASRPMSRLVWLNREGHKVGDIPGEFDDRLLSLSRTSSHLVLDRFESPEVTTRDVWVVDYRRGTSTRITSDRADDCCPIFSPDGRRMVFNSNRGGTPRHLYEADADSLEPPRLLLETPNHKYPKDWSRDGRFIAFETVGGDEDRDVWLLPLFGDRQPFSVVETPADESSGRFSPDGRWLAYVSNQSGRYEVYVQSLVDTGRRRLQVSTEGGFYPRWRDDGRELFYVAPDRRLMTVAVASTGSDLKLEVPRPLFVMPIIDPATQQFTDKYDVAPDGQRFIVFETANPNITADLTVIVNWTPPRRE